MKVSIDLGICQGYACCLMESPEVFDLDDADDRAVLMTPEPPPHLPGRGDHGGAVSTRSMEPCCS